jgi:hypothetical protein
MAQLLGGADADRRDAAFAGDALLGDPALRAQVVDQVVHDVVVTALPGSRNGARIRHDLVAARSAREPLLDAVAVVAMRVGRARPCMQAGCMRAPG